MASLHAERLDGAAADGAEDGERQAGKFRMDDVELSHRAGRKGQGLEQPFEPLDGSFSQEWDLIWDMAEILTSLALEADMASLLHYGIGCNWSS